MVAEPAAVSLEPFGVLALIDDWLEPDEVKAVYPAIFDEAPECHPGARVLPHVEMSIEVDAREPGLAVGPLRFREGPDEWKRQIMAPPDADREQAEVEDRRGGFRHAPVGLVERGLIFARSGHDIA